MRRVESRFPRLDVAQRLVGGVVVEPVQLRQARETRIGLRNIVIAADDDLVIDAVDIEQVALNIGIKPRERNAAAQTAAPVDPAAVRALQVVAVIG